MEALQPTPSLLLETALTLETGVRTSLDRHS